VPEHENEGHSIHRATVLDWIRQNLQVAVGEHEEVYRLSKYLEASIDISIATPNYHFLPKSSVYFYELSRREH
jgi:hypothetical protein